MKKMSLNSVSGKTSKLVVTVVLALVYVCLTGTAWAKDSMNVSVENATREPDITVNGQANGTIQLIYTVNANAFTLGEFATFDVKWLTIAGKPATVYGSGITFSLNQDQQGGHVVLKPSPDEFTLTGANQSGTSTVTIFIEAGRNGNVPSSADGTNLVGNLKLVAGDVRTVTNIQVHIRLVRPVLAQCIKVYNFVTDQEFKEGILETTSLKIGANGPKAGKVINSSPSQFSDNVLIANTCTTDESFDLGIGLPDSFSTSPNSNPGNAVFTYAATGEFDNSNFNAMMAAGTANKQNLCLQNVTVPAGTSLLATVHSKVRDNWPQTSLPAESFDFAAKVYQNVNLGCTGPLHPLASKNPATFVLPFTIN